MSDMYERQEVRQEVLESLYNITFNEDPSSPRYEKARSYIKSVLSSKVISEEVVSFITDEVSVGYAKDFFSRLKSKKFMRTLKNLETNPNVPDEVVIKAITSMVTHAIIDIELGNATRQVVVSNLRIDQLLSIVGEYFKTGVLPDSTSRVIRDLINTSH